ncbi:tetratricopeptide repeat protein [Streptomyces sp. NBC_00316]|uniref:tetratricopeptide repeat protein n=1 Tax=Streptomyces sp. NBC_00316 TaxID=2975710 RepID=UPI002E28D407|nr:tetratricopeptide repeat protein [Streptomyces sp. NBC_00316]
MTIQHVTATGGFAYGAIGADIHVFGDGTPLYILKSWSPAPEPEADWLTQQPSRMLNARFAVAPFTGRDSELAALRSWCVEGLRRAVRWLHAPGGQGKTRLAHQLAQELDTQGWKVVTAVEGPGSVLPPPGSQDLRLDGAAGLLVLVDYADRWPLTSLTWLLSNALLHQPEVPTRVLLLARSTDPWPALRAALANEEVDVSAQALGPLTVAGEPGQRGDHRGAMFRAARDGFAARYGIAPEARQPDLHHPDFGLTLAVHMAALVAVDALATGRRAPQDLAGLTVYLLDREQLGWALLNDKRGEGRVSVPPAVMNRVVFTASLGGTQPTARGTLLVDALRLDHRTATVLADHAVCYPPPDSADDTVLEPLYPDRLAEDFVALTLPGHPADYPAQAWAPDTAATVLRGGGGPARAVTALATAAGRWPHVGATCLYPLLTADPGLGVAAGGAALTALADLADIEPGLLEDIAAQVPDPVPADLVVGQAALRVRLFGHRLAATDDPAAQARLFVNHGNNLDDLGRTEESLRSAQRGAEIFGDLAVTDPEQYEEHVGRALTNVAGQLARLGRLDEALSTQQQVVDLFERLTATDQAAHAPDLATALANLSAVLERCRRWEEAYLANERAAVTYRNVAARDPQYRRGLAIALTNGASLTFRPPAGADRLREAVALSRELVADGALPEDTPLVPSLSRLRKQLTADGCHAEAVEVAQEVAAIGRRLAEASPQHYAGSSAASLMDLHTALLDARHPGEALAVGEEAIALLRRLAGTAPATYEGVLLSALHAQNDARQSAGLPKDPEADARSPRLDPDHMRRIPAATITVHGWRPDPRPGRALAPAALHAEAARLTKLRDWPAYWELVCAAPLADAVRLVRRLPRRGWSPASLSDRELLSWLRATSPRHADPLIADAAVDATRLLPEDLGLYSAPHSAFAYGGGVLAMAHVVTGADRGRAETIETLDLDSGRRTVLHRGPVRHASLACLGTDDVVAVRRRPGRGSEAELVRHRPGDTRVLAQDHRLTGLRVATTLGGCVVGLALVPAAFVLGRTGQLRQVDLYEWALTCAHRMAVTPAGDRMVLCDGRRLIAADASLTRALAAASVPQGHAQVSDLVFADEDLLVTAGNHGGLMLWRLGGSELEPVARRDTVRMSELFAVPAWGVVGGKAGSEDRVHFFDPADGLAPVAAPLAFVGDAGHLKSVAAAPGGRFVAYSGQLDVTAPLRSRSFAWLSRVHDLHHPGALLHRPLAAFGDAELAALARANGADPWLRDLFRLAHSLASRP